jgi:hypothetical protein
MMLKEESFKKALNLLPNGVILLDLVSSKIEFANNELHSLVENKASLKEVEGEGQPPLEKSPRNSGDFEALKSKLTLFVRASSVEGDENGIGDAGGSIRESSSNPSDRSKAANLRDYLQ